MNDTKSESLKSMAGEVLNALKYSDPMSSVELAGTEEKIESLFAEFAGAVRAENVELAKTCRDGLLSLINERNNKCKILK